MYIHKPEFCRLLRIKLEVIVCVNVGTGDINMVIIKLASKIGLIVVGWSTDIIYLVHHLRLELNHLEFRTTLILMMIWWPHQIRSSDNVMMIVVISSTAVRWGQHRFLIPCTNPRVLQRVVLGLRLILLLWMMNLHRGIFLMMFALILVMIIVTPHKRLILILVIIWIWW